MNENSCTCGACVVPLVDVIGVMPAAEAERWAASEGIQLRSTWNGRLALDADDAATVFERATAAAEAARARNEAKTRALVASLAPTPPGRPIPEGLGDLAAIDVMLTQDKTAERLDAADERWAELVTNEPGTYVFHPINPEQG